MSKTCTRCRVEKPLSDFYFMRTKGKSDRYGSACKTCVSYERKAIAYGLSFEDVYTLYTDSPTCGICGGEPTGRGNYHMDHCHDTGGVRGLLCHHCNIGLGFFRHDPTLLDKAKEYLKCQK